MGLGGRTRVSVYAEPRLTRDVDLVVAVDDDKDAESIIYKLQLLGYRVSMLLEQQATQRLATVRLQPPQQGSLGVVVDLLFTSSGIENEIAADAESIELIPQLYLPVATIGHLLALKILARDDRRRPQDWDDLRALLQEANDTEIRRARNALDLIQARGFQRNKNLHQDFEALLLELRAPS